MLPAQQRRAAGFDASLRRFVRTATFPLVSSRPVSSISRAVPFASKRVTFRFPSSAAISSVKPLSPGAGMSFQESQDGFFASVLWLPRQLGLISCALAWSRPRDASASIVDSEAERVEAEDPDRQMHERLRIRALQ